MAHAWQGEGLHRLFFLLVALFFLSEVLAVDLAGPIFAAAFCSVSSKALAAAAARADSAAARAARWACKKASRLEKRTPKTMLPTCSTFSRVEGGARTIKATATAAKFAANVKKPSPRQPKNRPALKQRKINDRRVDKIFGSASLPSQSTVPVASKVGGAPAAAAKNMKRETTCMTTPARARTKPYLKGRKRMPLSLSSSESRIASIERAIGSVGVTMVAMKFMRPKDLPPKAVTAPLLTSIPLMGLLSGSCASGAILPKAKPPTWVPMSNNMTEAAAATNRSPHWRVKPVVESENLKIPQPAQARLRAINKRIPETIAETNFWKLVATPDPSTLKSRAYFAVDSTEDAPRARRSARRRARSARQGREA
mmetsp:Transcript_72379/g.151044  ORF Transcript_72379/g.151044 Transcript_72379/m.151044 type:complete len:369 (-) Transcript_72379:727-1833(-)